MELTNKKVLITGAGGFIGSHLTEELLNNGCKIRVFLRYKSSGSIGNLEELPKEALEKIEIVRGDLKNYDSVRRAVKEMDIIFHLGALISIPYSYTDPRDYVDTNVTGTLNILKASQDYGIKRVILTSTSEVYGTAKYTPIDENHPLQAQSPYSASKISADKIAESFYDSFNLPITIIRPFNTYGPRQSKRAIIPTIIYQAVSNNKIKLGSLEPKRDLTFVKDTIQGFVKAAESEKSIGETINICSGKAISMRELVEKTGELIGRKIEVETDEKKIRPKNSEVMLLLGKNQKAKELLGWSQKHTLELGLKQTIEYIKNNLEKYRLERGNI